MKRKSLLSLLFAPVLAVMTGLIGGCGDDGSLGPGEESGVIAVTTQTSAATAEAALDPDGYVVSVEGLGTRSIDLNGEATFTAVPPGDYLVKLSGLQANCTTTDNTHLAVVVPGGKAQTDFPVTCWPPTRGRIVFTSDRGGRSNVFSVNPDGTGLVQVTDLVGSALWPVWSPDGWKIAFTYAQNNLTEDIYVVNSTGTGLTRVTSNTYREEVPAWSPDGTKIAFSRYTGATWQPEDIWVAQADGGGNEVRLTTDPARDLSPAWSPDGTRIAFTSDRDGNEEVYVMNADGTNPVNLTKIGASDVVWAGGWSPDGTKIVFSSNREGDFDVFVMNADGSNPVNLTRSPLQEHGGSWSPDGTKVVFWQGPTGDIFIVNADGTGMVDITNSGDVLDRYPHWSWGSGILAADSGGVSWPDPSANR